MRRVGGALDLNSSSLGGGMALGGLDSSMLSMGGGCGDIDTTARLGGARASLSTSQFGRGSFVRPGGAPPSTKKPAHAVGRPSLALQPGDRRLSAMQGRPTLGGGALSAPKLRADMPDPRPLNTAAWKADAAQKVFDFLTETAYPQRVSTKLLLGPTAKDFQAILTHIARTLDNHYVMTGKLEDEVAALAKALNYPFTPSKTAIATVGAAHSWPPLLGMLVWMTDLARYHSCLRGRQEEDEAALLSALAGGGGGGGARSSSASHAVAGTSEHFWWYIREAYSAYLAGEDEAVEATEAGISAAFDGAAAAAEGECASAERALSASVGELEVLGGGQSVLPALHAAKSEISGDVARLQAALREMEAYRDSLAKKRSDKGEEIGALESELARARGEAERVQSIVAGQELSVEDVRRLKAQAAALRERRAALDSERSALEKAIAGAREEIKGCLAALETRLRDYHEKARGLQLVPRGAKWSSNVDFTLRLDERSLESIPATGASSSSSDVQSERRAAASALVGADMKGVIKLNLRFLKTQLVKHATGVRGSIAAVGEEVESSVERRGTLARSVAEAEKATAALEAAARREAEAGDARLGESSATIAAARAACDAKRASAGSASASAEELGASVLLELRASIASMEAAQRAERQRMSDLVARCLLRVSEHKQEARTRLDNAAAAIITAKNRVAAGEAERAARLRGGDGGAMGAAALRP